MRIIVAVIKVAFVALLLYFGTTILGDRYQGVFAPAGSYPFGFGGAPENVRSEIIDTLGFFQQGYEARDPQLLEPFMKRLFSTNNVTVLGTMPQEVFVGFDRATELVRTDWQFWGDCRFDVENAHISAKGDVGWFSTVGYVEFDLSRFLVLPLRLSGVFVREDGSWRIQHLQFQFDLNLSFLILINVLLGVWFVLQIFALSVIVFRRVRQRSQASGGDSD